MALYGVVIEKETQYHSLPERFGNTYFYQGPTFQLGDANFERLVDQLVAAEKQIHNAEVAFKQARVWSAGGTPSQNETLLLKDLTGLGTMLQAQSMHSEAAVMLEWETSRVNVLGRKVYLRKFIRSQGLPGTATTSMARSKERLGADVMAPYKTYGDTIDQLDTGGVLWALVSPTNRPVRFSDNAVVDPFLRTREFRQN